MDKKKKLNIEEIEQMLDRKLTVAEVYANRPHKWIVYTAIVLIIVTLVGWSAADIKFTGLTAAYSTRIPTLCSAPRIPTCLICCCKLWP